MSAPTLFLVSGITYRSDDAKRPSRHGGRKFGSHGAYVSFAWSLILDWIGKDWWLDALGDRFRG